MKQELIDIRKRINDLMQELTDIDSTGTSDIDESLEGAIGDLSEAQAKVDRVIDLLPQPLTYKVVCNFIDLDFYTDDKTEAEAKFKEYVKDYGDGIRLYEAINPIANDEAPDWDTVDSFDAEDTNEE